VKRVERLGEATAPDGTQLVLYRHDGAYSIRVNGAELMSTRRHHSEEKLAELACAPIATTSGARVLIGGLGLGFTLRAALRILGADATVVVAELVPAVIEWNMNPDYALARDVLLDPRVELREADVGRVIAEGRASFDAIMLDVDNGPDPLTTTGNAGLYDDGGIRTTIAALRPGGRVAYWSATPEPGFERALRRCGLEVETVKASTWDGSRSKHAILIARRPG
jgi:spermidine synthase